MRFLLPIVSASSLLVIAACSSSNPPPVAIGPLPDAGAPDAEADGCPTGAMGTLDLQISGSSAIDGYAVTILGIDERVSERATSTTFLTLPTGRYHVLADTITTPLEYGSDPSLVRRVYAPNVVTPQICVRDEETTTGRVFYGALQTDGSLFMAHSKAAGQVARLSFPSVGLSKSTVDTFDVRTAAARGLAFDPGGNLWIAGGGFVERVPGMNLVSSGTGAPDRVIKGALFSEVPGPTALAFDPEGDLWVSLPGAKKIVELPGGTLSGTGSGKPSPSVVIDGESFVDLPAMAFDENGDLFVASGDHVLRFGAAKLASGTNLTADVDVTAKRTSAQPLTGIRDLAFDAAGSLWVAYAGSDVVARLDPPDLAGIGAREVTPKLEVQLETPGVLDAIAFDEAGGLWLGHGPAKLGRLTRQQLLASGTVTPAQLVDGDGLGHASRLAFFPAPRGTPLYAAIP